MAKQAAKVERQSKPATNNELPQQPAPKKRRQFKWSLLILAALFFLLGSYGYSRITSSSRKIQLHVIQENDADESVNKDASGINTFVIATWNIAHGRGCTDDNWAEGGDEKKKRVSEIAKLIREFDADVVVLNEVDFCASWSGGINQAAAIAEEAGYPYYLTQSNLDFSILTMRWHFGNVLLSRYPIKKEEVIEFAPLNEWEDWLVGCKRGFACEVRPREFGTPIKVMGMHWESRGEEVRVKQALDVALHVNASDVPVVLAGDLNTTPSWAPKSNTNNKGENAFEVFEQASALVSSASAAPTTGQLTFPADDPQTLIDWVFYRPGYFQSVEQEVIPTDLSDHLPVVATFKCY